MGDDNSAQPASQMDDSYVPPDQQQADQGVGRDDDWAATTQDGVSDEQGRAGDEQDGTDDEQEEFPGVVWHDSPDDVKDDAKDESADTHTNIEGLVKSAYDAFDMTTWGPPEREPHSPPKERADHIEMHEMVEHEPDAEISEHLQKARHAIHLPQDLKDIGVLEQEENAQHPTPKTIKIPLTDDQIAQGLSSPIDSSVRWLAESCKRMFEKIGIRIRVAHGKAERIVKNPSKKNQSENFEIIQETEQPSKKLSETPQQEKLSGQSSEATEQEKLPEDTQSEQPSEQLPEATQQEQLDQAA